MSRNINLETNVQDSVFQVNKQPIDTSIDARLVAAEARTDAEKRREESKRKVAEFQSKTKARTRASKAKIATKDAVSKALEDAVAVDADEVPPALQPALDALNSITKRDLKRQVLDVRNLPSGIARVVDAVGILLLGEEGVVPAKKLLADPAFLSRLRPSSTAILGPNNIKASRVYKLRMKYMDKQGNEEFPNVEMIAKESTAAAALCAWVHGIHQCAPARPRPARPSSAPAAVSTTLRPKTASKEPKIKAARAPFKGKPAVIASSTDSNPWNYESPRVSADGALIKRLSLSKGGTPKRPQKKRISADEKIAQERAEEEARVRAVDQAAKARQLAAARAKVTAAKRAEDRARRVAEEAVRRPERLVSATRPLAAPRTVYSTKAKDAYALKVKERKEALLAEAAARDTMFEVHPLMAPALESLKNTHYAAAKELASCKTPPGVVLKVGEAICVLVGEEPGWVRCQKLLLRRDFLPTLARSTSSTVPAARLKKFRAQYLAPGDFPSVTQCAKVSDVAAALCRWALAIEATAGLPLPNDPSRAAVPAPVPEMQKRGTTTVKAVAGTAAPTNEDLRDVDKVEMRKSATAELLATAVQELRMSEEAAAQERYGVHAPAPSIDEAFAALKGLTRADCVRLSRAKDVPRAVQVSMGSVCILVGEEPGWEMSSRLLARDDFVPTLAACGPERVPVGRINKFRAMYAPAFPSPAEAQACGAVCSAMAKWVLAISNAFPAQRETAVAAAGPKKAVEDKHARGSCTAANPLKGGAARVPSPEKAAASRAASERAAADIDPTLTPADLRKILS